MRAETRIGLNYGAILGLAGGPCLFLAAQGTSGCLALAAWLTCAGVCAYLAGRTAGFTLDRAPAGVRAGLVCAAAGLGGTIGTCFAIGAGASLLAGTPLLPAADAGTLLLFAAIALGVAALYFGAAALGGAIGGRQGQEQRPVGRD